MGKISQLLRWKISYQLLNESDEPIPNGKVWIRIIGDHDSQDAYTHARIRSAAYRKALLTEGSDEWKDVVEPVGQATLEQARDMVLQGQTNNIVSMAEVTTERPELPKLEEVAVDPDAATLEEQEKFDALIAKTEADYRKAKDDYIEERVKAINAEINLKSLDEIRESAKTEVVNIMALKFFIEAMTEEKTWRGIYEDEACKVRGFDSIDDFSEATETIKDQLKRKYVELEMNGEDIKN